MGRPRKDGQYLNVCIDKGLYDRLSEYCVVSGQSKTVVVERVIGNFLDEYESNPAAALESLQKKVKP